MNEFAIAIIFGGVIAEQAHIEKIGSTRLEFKRGQIALIQGGGIGPDPANPIFLEKPDDLRPVPAEMTKLDGKPKVVRQLGEKSAQSCPSIVGRKRRRKLHEDNVELGGEWLDCMEETCQLGAAIAQLAFMRDLARELAGKTKMGRGKIEPAADRMLGGRGIEGGIDFNCGKVTRVKFEPALLRKISRIKYFTPFRKGPCAGSDTNFLLIVKVQRT